jgi:hypothetical protein
MLIKAIIMPAPKTSVGKTVQATEPQFLGTSRVQHTSSIIMTVAVDLLLFVDDPTPQGFT